MQKKTLILIFLISFFSISTLSPLKAHGSLEFSLREHKYYVAYNPDFTFSKPDGTNLRCYSTKTSLGRGWVFVVVPREWLNGKYVRFYWVTWSNPTHSGSPYVVFIMDGSYDRSSDTDFPSGSHIPTKGSGLLQIIRSKSTNGGETVDVQVSIGGTEEYCTIFFRLSDGWNTNELYIQIDYVEINLGSGGADCLYREHFTDSVHMEQTGTYGDYGYISEGSVSPIFLTLYFTTYGKFILNGTLATNGTSTEILNQTLYRLVGAPNNNKLWVKFTINSIDYTTNNYNYTILGNTTMWCIFNTPSGNGEVTENPYYVLIIISFASISLGLIGLLLPYIGILGIALAFSTFIPIPISNPSWFLTYQVAIIFICSLLTLIGVGRRLNK